MIVYKERGSFSLLTFISQLFFKLAGLLFLFVIIIELAVLLNFIGNDKSKLKLFKLF